jgi:uncharacterized protein with GYD domain
MCCADAALRASGAHRLFSNTGILWKPERRIRYALLSDRTIHTPSSLSYILDNPKTNRQEAAKKAIETAGGKLISFYGTPVEGPGVLVIFDVPDPGAAAAISGVVIAAEVLQNVKLTRLLTQDEIFQVRKHAVKVRSAYKPPRK